MTKKVNMPELRQALDKARTNRDRAQIMAGLPTRVRQKLREYLTKHKAARLALKAEPVEITKGREMIDIAPPVEPTPKAATTAPKTKTDHHRHHRRASHVFTGASAC